MNSVSTISQPRLPEKSGALPSLYTVQEAKAAALSCTTIEGAMEHATMRQLCTLGEGARQEVIVAAGIIIERGMDYFGAGRRMSENHVAMFARKVVDQFYLESLADLNVFMENAAMGRYDGGEYYSSVDIPRLGKWWEKYLGEKADERERVERQKSSQLTSETLKGMAMVPGMTAMLKKVSDDRKAELSRTAKAARLLRLQHEVPEMSEEELRKAWTLYNAADERKFIQGEAARRGMLGEELKAAQLAIDEETRQPSEPPAAA